MAAPVDVKYKYERAEGCLLYIVSWMGGRRCCCIPRSKIRGEVHNGGTVGEWLGGVGGGLVAMLT